MRQIGFLASMLLALLLAGGSALAADALPPNPPGVSAPEEYSFGDVVAAKDWRAVSLVLDTLEDRFGEKSMRITIRNLDDAADPEAIKAYYMTHLPGWIELELDADPRRQSWSFALVSPDQDQAFAVVALTPEAAGYTGKVPMSVLTNLPPD